MKNLDIFGGETDINVKKPQYLTMLQKARYRKATQEEKDAGTVCKFCQYRIGIRGNTKNYYKCRWISMSSSAASDIRLSGTCPKWEKENPG